MGRAWRVRTNADETANVNPMANRPGRPPLDRFDKSVVVSLAMPGRVFDRYCRLANVERLTVPEVIRRALRNSENKKTETSDA